MTTSILAVNIRSGGTRSSISRLVERCFVHRCDVVVFSEFRNTTTGDVICELLRQGGYTFSAASGETKENGVLIASRIPFQPIANPFGLDAEEYPQAVLQANFEDGLRLYGVYLPGQDRKRPHLRCLVAAAQYCNDAAIDAICIGDFNSGRNATDIEINLGREKLRDEFSTADLYAELEQYWTEAWLHFHPGRREFSWYPFRLEEQRPRRNGWRIDKAFVSRSLLPHVASAEYDHGFRTERLTDHSALIVTLNNDR